jgi:hypothetical protein
MDEAVIESIRRWPDVPAVYGWLSLTARGQWRLHPDGMAYAGGAGEPITNPQILAFINRNYGCDANGRWFFQNGPQRVYIRLDAAPWILFADDAQGVLSTHTGQAVTSVTEGWVDDQGRLWLQTEHGVGMVSDRDLPRVLPGATTSCGQTFELWWQTHEQQHCQITRFTHHWQGVAMPLDISRLAPDSPIDAQLMFIANPQAS